MAGVDLDFNEILLGTPKSLEEKIVFLQMTQPRGFDLSGAGEAKHYSETIFKVFGKIATEQQCATALANIQSKIEAEAAQMQSNMKNEYAPDPETPET